MKECGNHAMVNNLLSTWFRYSSIMQGVPLELFASNARIENGWSIRFLVSDPLSIFWAFWRGQKLAKCVCLEPLAYIFVFENL